MSTFICSPHSSGSMPRAPKKVHNKHRDQLGDSEETAFKNAAAAARMPAPVAEVVKEKDAVTGQMVDVARRIHVPVNRFSPLKNAWMELIKPLVEILKVQIRMNVRRKCVEIRAGPNTEEPSGYLNKSAEYIKAFILGFAPQDAMALLRMDDLFLESFELKDVKTLKGEHTSRAIGRLVGKDGKTKNAIENATRTRIVVAGERVHLMGSYTNTKIARGILSQLIMGTAPNKVFDKLRIVSKRLLERL
jgi:RNA-binding protein PNO1